MTISTIRNRKGGAIVESAIIYPIIILTASILITITISLYTMVVIRVNCDLAVRGAAGEITGTILNKEISTNDFKNNVYKEDGYFGLFPEIAIKHTKTYGWDQLKPIEIIREEKSKFALHDECRFIRNANLITEGLVGIERLIKYGD